MSLLAYRPQKSLRRIAHEDKIAGLLAIAVDLDRLSFADFLDNDRDDAGVGAWVLARPKIIEGPDDRRINAKVRQ